jgi:hypothetical protein
MPELTRRRYPERPDCWHVYHDDVQAGTIAMRVGCPVDVDQMGMDLRVLSRHGAGPTPGGTAIDFDHARADFEAARRRILPTLTA